MKAGELASYALPEPNMVNFLVRPEQDRNFLLWTPIPETSDKNAQNLYTHLGHDVVFLVNSKPVSTEKQIFLLVQPFKGNNETAYLESEAKYGAWTCKVGRASMCDVVGALQAVLYQGNPLGPSRMVLRLSLKFAMI